MDDPALPEWLERSGDCLRIAVRVAPRARANSIDGVQLGRLKVRVTAAPEDGKANAAVCKLLAKRLGVGKTSLVVVRGESTRDKVIEVGGLGAGEVEDALSA